MTKNKNRSDSMASDGDTSRESFDSSWDDISFDDFDSRESVSSLEGSYRDSFESDTSRDSSIYNDEQRPSFSSKEIKESSKVQTKESSYIAEEQQSKFLKGVERVIAEMTHAEREKDRIYNQEHNKDKSLLEYSSFSPEFKLATNRLARKKSPEQKEYENRVKINEKDEIIKDLKILSMLSKEDRINEYSHRQEYAREFSDVSMPNSEAYVKAMRFASKNPLTIDNTRYERATSIEDVWRQQILPTSVTQNYRFFW